MRKGNNRENNNKRLGHRKTTDAWGGVKTGI